MSIEYFEIAKIVKTRGLAGEVKAVSYASSVSDFSSYGEYFVCNGLPAKNDIALKTSRVFEQNGAVVLKFKGIDTVEDAQKKLLRKSIFVKRDGKKLEENEFYIADLIGMTVVDADSQAVYGVVDDILQNAPTDVYSLKAPDGKNLLFPAIKEVLIDIDLSSRIIKIRPLAGLFDD